MLVKRLLYPLFLVSLITPSSAVLVTNAAYDVWGDKCVVLMIEEKLK